MKIDQLNYQIEFKDMYDNYNLMCKNLDLFQPYEMESKEFIEHMLHVFVFNSKLVVPFLKKFNSELDKFLLKNFNKIDFNHIERNTLTSKFLINHLFKSKEYIFQNQDLFFISLKYIDYNEIDLEQLVQFYFIDDKDPNTQKFWDLIAQYQPLTCTFIQKYYMKFLKPENAFKLKINSKNQLFHCHFDILKQILQQVLLYENEQQIKKS